MVQGKEIKSVCLSIKPNRFKDTIRSSEMYDLIRTEVVATGTYSFQESNR